MLLRIDTLQQRKITVHKDEGGESMMHALYIAAAYGKKAPLGLKRHRMKSSL